jgi:lipopolysaccharide transport system ATP-binding protein
MSDHILNVSGLGKCYKTYRSNFARFASWLGFSSKPTDEYWALKGLEFTLRRGEALAIIGQNGAGKSTLLKLITGTIRPNTGTVQINGRVSAILELGLGFNPDFTGRQNVYLAGGLMGLSVAEIKALMPSIQEFTEIGMFFERSLRVYSSGMQARLAFAVATAVRPEVLIVDEVLSVGDSYFQHKSFARIREFREQGTSILLVTHGLGEIRGFCDRVILLESGVKIQDGAPDLVIDYYNALIAAKENAKLSIEQRRMSGGWLFTKSGTGEARVESINLIDGHTGLELNVVQVGQYVVLQVTTFICVDITKLVLGVRISNKLGHVIWGTNTYYTNQVENMLKTDEKINYKIKFDCNLGPGSYAVSIALCSSESHLSNNYEWSDNLFVFDVINVNKFHFAGSQWIDADFVVERV